MEIQAYSFVLSLLLLSVIFRFYTTDTSKTLILAQNLLLIAAFHLSTLLGYLWLPILFFVFDHFLATSSSDENDVGPRDTTHRDDTSTHPQAVFQRTCIEGSTSTSAPSNHAISSGGSCPMASIFSTKKTSLSDPFNKSYLSRTEETATSTDCLGNHFNDSSKLHGKPMVFFSDLKHRRMLPFKLDFQHSYMHVGTPVGLHARYGSVSIDTTDRSFNSWFSILSQNYLLRGGANMSLGGKLREYLLSENVDPSEWSYAYHVSMPAVLGQSNNPLGYWFLYSSDRTLTALILELNTSYWERRIWFVRRESKYQVNDGPWCFHGSFQKDLLVSPFNPSSGKYTVYTNDPTADPAGDLRVKISLKSTSGETRMLAQIRPREPSLDLSSATFTEHFGLLVRWFWVPMPAVTVTRILTTALWVYLKAKPLSWLHPEPPPTATAKPAIASERILERHFRALLKDTIEKHTTPIALIYKTSGEHSPRVDYFYSRQSQSMLPILQDPQPQETDLGPAKQISSPSAPSQIFPTMNTSIDSLVSPRSIPTSRFLSPIWRPALSPRFNDYGILSPPLSPPTNFPMSSWSNSKHFRVPTTGPSLLDSPPMTPREETEMWSPLAMPVALSLTNRREGQASHSVPSIAIPKQRKRLSNFHPEPLTLIKSNNVTPPQTPILSEGDPVMKQLTIQITTPTFYSRVFRYGSLSEAFTHELLDSPSTRTASCSDSNLIMSILKEREIARPVKYEMVLDPRQSFAEGVRSSLISRLRCAPLSVNFPRVARYKSYTGLSSMEQWIKDRGTPQQFEEYQRATLWLYISDWIACPPWVDLEILGLTRDGVMRIWSAILKSLLVSAFAFLIGRFFFSEDRTGSLIAEILATTGLNFCQGAMGLLL